MSARAERPAAWNPGLRVPTQKFWRWFCSGGQKIVRSGNGPSKFKVKLQEN